MVQPILIIHGGAGSKFDSASRADSIRGKIAAILEAVYPVLLEKGALEAVVQAVKMLEDDPAFNAGTGSRIQEDGHARLSASVMDGPREQFGAVINLEDIQNPVLIARALLEKEFRVLSDRGAGDFALSLGHKKFDTKTPVSIERWRTGQSKGADTVGACALDANGRLASATSTGGRGNETPGRVSDSAMPVACYATDKCAVSATGIGEEIIEQGLAVAIATRVHDGLSLKDAFAKSFSDVRRKKRRMGAIGLSNLGEIARETSTELLIYGWMKDKQREIF